MPPPRTSETQNVLSFEGSADEVLRYTIVAKVRFWSPGVYLVGGSVVWLEVQSGGYSCHAWPSYDYGPWHVYNAGTEQVGLSRTEQAFLCCSKREPPQVVVVVMVGEVALFFLLGVMFMVLWTILLSPLMMSLLLMLLSLLSLADVFSRGCPAAADGGVVVVAI